MVEPRLLMSADFMYNAATGQTLNLTISGSLSAPIVNLTNASNANVGGSPQNITSTPGTTVTINTAQAPLVSGAPASVPATR